MATDDNEVTASALAAAPADCGAGAVATAIAASGALTCSISPIVSADIDTFSELDTIVADKALVNKADGAVWLGVHDFGGATSVEIPNDAAPTVNAAGEIAVDTTDDQLKNFG